MTATQVAAAVGRKVRLGKLSVEKDPRNLLMARYLDDAVALPQVPAAVDWSTTVAAWPMYDNDTLSDCTCAAVGHMEEAWSASVGAPFVPSDQAVVALYWATGKKDTGRTCLTILKRWAKTGFAGGHKLTGFTQIDEQSQQHVEFACWAFGGVYIGIQLPISAQGQTSGWTVGTGPDADPGSWGGHCVNLVGYSATGPTCVTWGRLMPMTWQFFATYCDEAYALISPDFLGPQLTGPSGFNLSQLEQDVAALRK